MKLILLIINIIYVLGYHIPQDTRSSKSNDNVSILSHFNLQACNQQIHNQIKQLPDSIVKNIQWQYLDSFICFNCKANVHVVWKNGIQEQNDHTRDFQDTIYIIQQSGLQGDFNMTLWDRQKSVSYTNETGQIKETNSRLFSKYMLKLISEWDISAIREEEKINGQLIPRERIYAIRIILHRGKCSIDFLWFYDFFNLERDRFDFRSNTSMCGGYRELLK